MWLFSVWKIDGKHQTELWLCASNLWPIVTLTKVMYAITPEKGGCGVSIIKYMGETIPDGTRHGRRE